MPKLLCAHAMFCMLTRKVLYAHSIFYACSNKRYCVLRQVLHGHVKGINFAKAYKHIISIVPACKVANNTWAYNNYCVSTKQVSQEHVIFCLSRLTLSFQHMISFVCANKRLSTCDKFCLRLHQFLSEDTIFFLATCYLTRYKTPVLIIGLSVFI